MSRLIVEAVSSDSPDSSSRSEFSLKALVSVSFSDTGLPVTGLQPQNFFITGNQDAKPEDGTVLTCAHLKERTTLSSGTLKNNSGVYELDIQSFQPQGKNDNTLPFSNRVYTFGIQVASAGRGISYHGQTVVAVYNR